MKGAGHVPFRCPLHMGVGQHTNADFMREAHQYWIELL